MKKKLLALCGIMVLSCALAAGCAGGKTTKNVEEKKVETTSESEKEEEAVAQEPVEEKKEAELEDGVYVAEFHTDSNMFHVNETKEGKGELTVKDGEMTIHVSLVSKNIVNLFVGVKEDAQKDDAVLLEPTTDTVTYADGVSEEVYGFDIPVPSIDEEYDLALIGKKGKWYDHKVYVSNPQKQE